MEFIKDADPARRIKYLTARLEDMKLRCFLETKDLLPVEAAPAGPPGDSPSIRGLEWQPAGKNFSISPDGGCWWLRKKLPDAELMEGEFLALRLSFGKTTEGLVYLGGRMYSMFPAGNWGDSGMVRLREDSRGGELLVNLYSRNQPGSMSVFPEQTLDSLELLRVSEKNLELYDAFCAACGAFSVMEENSPFRHHLINSLCEAYCMLDFSSAKAYCESAPEALNFVSDEIFNGKDMLPVEIGVFGHAHIDVSWLWNIDAARDKAIRTFAGQLELLDNYEGWNFLQGQPQLYELVKEKTPELYEEIKRMARNRRLLPEGAAWVEFDCNITGGESIVRQLMYGTGFFKREFGVENRVLWLPDVFGFSASLPQIFKKCGIALFMTTKLSWNENTRFPYDTFWWQGIDGTRILSHFVTSPGFGVGDDRVHSYNTHMRAEEAAGTWSDYLQKDLNSELVMPFGYGDGGGGPRDFMVRRLKWLMRGIRGFVKVRGESLESYREKLFSKDASKYPVWNGELYLQAHRGCLTTRAFCKKENRRLEFMIERAEILSLLSGLGREHTGSLEKAWKLLLLNQFHDILPGSSIREVYDEALGRYKEIENRCGVVIKNSVEEFIKPDDGFVTVFNPFSWEYNGYVSMGAGLRPLDCCYEVVDGESVFPLRGLKPLGFVSLPAGRQNPGEGLHSRPARRIQFIQNDFCRVGINTKRGSIVSLSLAGSGREFISEGCEGNLFEIYEDKPVQRGMGAWNLEYFHQFKRYPCEPVLLADPDFSRGDICRRVKMKYRLLNSIVEQEVMLFKEDPLVYFRTRVDWRENEAVLKVAFPVKINARSASYDIQFGSFERPVHKNYLHDHASFEQPAHKWVDLSEGACGCAVITDSKYGYCVHESRISVTLLRAPASPDEDADRGVHEFTYALYPHEGSWREADLPARAFEVNHPPFFFSGRLQDSMTAGGGGLVEIADATGDGFVRGLNIILETLKVSEDKKGVVARLYECKNMRGRFRFKLSLPGFNVKRAFICTIVEEEECQIDYDINSGAVLSCDPYEIITLKFLPGGD